MKLDTLTGVIIGWYNLNIRYTFDPVLMADRERKLKNQKDKVVKESKKKNIQLST